MWQAFGLSEVSDRGRSCCAGALWNVEH